MSIPPWLFDDLADHLDDDGELVARAKAWAALLDGAEEIDASPTAPEPMVSCSRLHGEATYTLTLPQAGFLRAYEARRSAGARAGARRSDYWEPSGVTVEPDETHCLAPARAARLAGVSTQRLAALRRRGKLRSIGMTAPEYKRARDAAGWGDAQGWGPGVFYLREDIEALAKGRSFK